jgi:hypothetical protein
MLFLGKNDSGGQEIFGIVFCFSFLGKNPIREDQMNFLPLFCFVFEEKSGKRGPNEFSTSFLFRF